MHKQMMSRFWLLAVASGFFLSCFGAYAETPGGIYKLDPAHTSVNFKIGHLGFSHFTGRFDKCQGSLIYNTDKPEQSQLDVTVYPTSIDTNVPALDEALTGANWFNASKFPTATYHLTNIDRKGDKKAKLTGDFTLHGVTHRLTLDAELVGAGPMPLTNETVMGFNATGSFNRSDYGINNLQPIVGDQVTLDIDAEFDHAVEK